MKREGGAEAVSFESFTIEEMSQDVEELQQQTVIIQQDDGAVMAYIQTEDGTHIPLDQAAMEHGHLVAAEDADGMELAEGTLTISPEDGTMVISDSSQFEDGTMVIAENTQFLEETVEDQVEHVIDGDGNVTTVPLDSVTLSEEAIEDDESEEYQNIIIQHMDIEEPLSTLRKLLEARLQCSLADHEFYLQDSIPLEPGKNLVSQCVQGSGMVQINVEVKSHTEGKPRLNIVDILKPADEVNVPAAEPAPATPTTSRATSASNKVVIPFPEEAENVTRWIVDQTFRKEQERLKIPFDPTMWNQTHVKFWIQWAIKEFELEGVEIDSFNLTGKQLCELKHADFIKYIPNDKGDIFWTHLELLRKCKFVAVIQQPTPHAITTITVSTSHPDLEGRPRSFSRVPKSRTIMLPSDRATSGNRTGNNGQIQLWQFLLELLTDKDCREVIHWVGDEGEFKLNNPEMVAQLWGQRKNKPTMNYEKLSRALRYYYDGDMIAKVHGKRFVYKFVCDLRMLLGYSAAELNRLVSECAEKKIQKVRETLRQGISKRVIEQIVM